VDTDSLAEGDAEAEAVGAVAPGDGLAPVLGVAADAEGVAFGFGVGFVVGFAVGFGATGCCAIGFIEGHVFESEFWKTNATQPPLGTSSEVTPKLE